MIGPKRIPDEEMEANFYSLLEYVADKVQDQGMDPVSYMGEAMVELKKAHRKYVIMFLHPTQGVIMGDSDDINEVENMMLRVELAKRDNPLGFKRHFLAYMLRKSLPTVEKNIFSYLKEKDSDAKPH